jgi:hypothetical protein
MQSTIVILLALSGPGCHHKLCSTPFEDCCATAELYAIDYETVVEPSCYNPCYGCCYDRLRGVSTRDGWGPAAGGYVGCFAGGAVGCGSTRFPHH